LFDVSFPEKLLKIVATSSGVARVLTAHAQRQVMGPLVTKQLNTYSFAAMTAVTRPVDRLWRLRAQTMCIWSDYKHKVAKCCNP